MYTLAYIQHRRYGILCFAWITQKHKVNQSEISCVCVCMTVSKCQLGMRMFFRVRVCVM